MESCAPFDAAQGYALSLLRTIDCRAALLGEGGYGALSAAGSPIILALGGLLTILIAWQGYRLLLGDQITAREGVLLAAKVGLVLAFATQWPAYRAVVYNFAVEAPKDIASLMPGGGGTTDNLSARLQRNYQIIMELARPSDRAASIGTGPEQSAASGGASRILPFSLAGNPLLIAAGIFLLVSSLAILVSVRLLIGLLLALGPLFFACLLFDTTRGLFEGWVRTVIGMAIAALATGLLLGIELSIVEAQLGTLVDAMTGGALPVLAPGEILTTMIIFAIASIAGLIVSMKIGAGFRFLDRGAAIGALIAQRLRPSQHDPVSATSPEVPQPQQVDRSRALVMADSIAARDRIGTAMPSVARLAEPSRRIEAPADDQRELRPTPLGQTGKRSALLRRSKAMTQRNG